MSSFVDSEKNWIRARFFTFPQDYSKLVYISRDLRESFSSSFFLRGRNFNANADSVTFSGNYTPNFKLPSYPSPKKEKEEEKKNRSMQNTHRIAQGCAIVRSIKRRLGAQRLVRFEKWRSTYRADDKDPVFSRSGGLPSSLSKKNFPCGAREAEQIFLLCKTDLTRARAKFHVGRHNDDDEMIYGWRGSERGRESGQIRSEPNVTNVTNRPTVCSRLLLEAAYLIFPFRAAPGHRPC